MNDTAATGLKKKSKNEFVETLVVVVEALIIALVFRTFLWQNFSIPTSSMQSTMMIGDYFVTNKWVWGLGKYSFPLPVPIGDRILAFNAPARGDIAVFFNAAVGEDYVKRVVGLPGDRIQMQAGRLHINGVMSERELVGEGVDHSSTGGRPVKIYRETLPNGVIHNIQEYSDEEFLDNTAEYLVPSGHYFMMGDNRDNSQDSRVLRLVGYVPGVNIIGKAEARYFSIKDNLPPWQLWQWPANVRWDRMFQGVDQSYTVTPSR